MRKHVVTAAALAFAALVAHAAPTKNPGDLVGTWTLDEGESEDPVKRLRGERGRGRDGRIQMSGGVFGVPVSSLPTRDKPEEPEQGSIAGVEHVFEATYRLGVRREGTITEIRYGTEPTLRFRDDEKVERNGVLISVKWEGGVLTITHQRDTRFLVSESYWVDARTGELHWTAELTRRGGTVDVDRVFYRSPATEAAEQ